MSATDVDLFLNKSLQPRSGVARLRDRLAHPVIDGDGHLLEFHPWVLDIAREIAGADVARRLGAVSASAEQRGGWGHLPARTFFALPAANTLDLMTATLPRLLHERLPAIGIDFALLYPSFGLLVLDVADDELRQAGCRALNMYYADAYAGLGDRLAPVAVIPTFTPEEALVELEYAVGHLGLKSIVMSGTNPSRSARGLVDVIAANDPTAYDPVWTACQRLGVAPAFHGIGYGWGTRTSKTNYIYNHLGNFAAAQEAVCRSLLMAGVPSRFPDLPFVFLEGGSAWAAQLLLDLIGHFEKRNASAVDLYDPARINHELVDVLVDRYGASQIRGHMDSYHAGLRRLATPDGSSIDDFRDTSFDSIDDIVRAFTTQFAFGCEADDPLASIAFDRRLLPGGGLRALFASDIGHWDVRDMSDVLIEAWELAERGHLSEVDFRRFACDNVGNVLTAMRPDFFDGTALAGWTPC